MFLCYKAYGLRIASNVPLPGLPVQPPDGEIDTQIRLKDGESVFPSVRIPLAGDFIYVSSNTDPRGQPNLKVGMLEGNRYFVFFYGDGARFAIDREGREIWGDWPDRYSIEDACTYLMGPVLAFILRLRGITCLHASAVVLGGRSIALFGLAGAGKSTTAAAFAVKGISVMSDDVVGLSDCGDSFFVLPGYPRVNLWPDSVQSLFGSEDALPHITPTWKKRYLALDQKDHRFQSEPLPLGAIYLLGDRESNLTAPVLEEVTGCEALTVLVGNTYLNYLLDREMRVSEFEVLSRVVVGVPIRRVRMTGDPSQVFDLCETITSDVRGLAARTSATVARVD